MEQLYRKAGRRYVPCDLPPDWHGFPCDGLWLVEHKPHCSSSKCIARIGEVPRIHPFAGMMVAHDELTTFIREWEAAAQERTAVRDKDGKLVQWTRPSYSEMAADILKFLASQDPTIRNIEF